MIAGGQGPDNPNTRYQKVTLIGDYEMLLRTHSDGYIKGDKYFFSTKSNKYLVFIKLHAENVHLKLNQL